MYLNAKDVPGAELTFANIKDHNVTQLKRWLECRGLPKTGKKTELVERYVLI